MRSFINKCDTSSTQRDILVSIGVSCSNTTI